MRIVFGLHDFSSFAGTETYTLTVVEELARLGHEVVVHPGSAGPIADIARERGVVVEVEPERLPGDCDAVVSQDAGSAYVLAARYPEARRLMVVHSDYYGLQSPPQLGGVCDAVVVLNERVRRHVESLASPLPILRLRQPVDLKRFGGRSRGGEPRQARRALVLGNYLRDQAADTVTAACRDAGLEPIVSGVYTTPTPAAEQAIADVEVVIGLGRCIVEAMASQRAAYVYGIAGGDGWVTPERYEALEADGFAGMATDVVIDRERLAADLAMWDPEMGARNRQLAWSHHEVGAHVAELVACLREIRSDGGRPLDHAAEMARLVRLEWQSWSRYAGALEENRELRIALERAEARRAALEEVHVARRHRIAALLAAPRQLLRRRPPR